MKARRSMLRFALSLGALCLLPGSALAQGAWPERPLRVVVSGAAGGATDAVARAIMAELSKRLGQPIVVENRPGASGAVAAEAVARSPGDGHTYLAAFGSHVVNRILQPKRPYSESDLTGVALFGRYPMVLVGAKTLPNTVRGLMEYARAKPGELTFASGGDGTLSHLAGELLTQSFGAKLTHVPYKGGNTALPDLFAGRVGLMFDTVSTLGPHVRADKLNAIALTGQQRSPQLPDTPTFAESGHPLVTAYAWTGLLTQGKTPPAIVERMSAEISTVLKLPSIQASLGGGIFGMELVGGTPAQMNQFMDAEEKLWGEVIRNAGIRPQQ
jgi:tripartite-type tricarboxylate transporter receptor subunit TctC